MRLIDTDILINLARGRLERTVLQWDKSERISDVSYIEFVQGCRNKHELATWRKTSAYFVLLPVTEEISHRARLLMEKYYLSHGMTLGDAFIAATALSQNLTLLTGNKKHFEYIPSLKTHFLSPS